MQANFYRCNRYISKGQKLLQFDYSSGFELACEKDEAAEPEKKLKKGDTYTL